MGTTTDHPTDHPTDRPTHHPADQGANSPRSAVIVGASVAGSAAALALAQRGLAVTLIERRPRDDDAEPGTHRRAPHVLLAGGVAALERLAPGVLDELWSHGAAGAPTGERRCLWWADGRVRTRLPDLGVPAPFCSRSLVESRLRARACAHPGVTLRTGMTFEAVRCGGGRVLGITAGDGADVHEFDADLTVIATGRGGRGGSWLPEGVGGDPPIRRVEVDLGYTIVEVERRPDDADGALMVMVQNGPELARMGVALAVEGDRWQIALGGYFGDHAGTDPAALRCFARSLPHPAVADLLDRDLLGAPQRVRFPASVRRHWELADLPEGVCVIGDAVASFNPIYGQGMSSALLQAEAVGAALDRCEGINGVARTVATEAARIVEGPWRIATGGDLAYDRTIGEREPGAEQTRRSIRQVFAAAATDPVVALAVARVQHLLAPPSTLAEPDITARVAAALAGAGGNGPLETR